MLIDFILNQLIALAFFFIIVGVNKKCVQILNLIISRLVNNSPTLNLHLLDNYTKILTE